MTAPRLPIAIPPTLRELTPDIPAAVFDERFRLACERLDAYVGALAAEIARALDLPAGRPLTADSLAAARGWAEQGKPALQWLLETLELYGLAQATAEGWLLSLPPAEPVSADLAGAAIEADPTTAPAFRVLQLAAAALPAVLAGEARGEDALFNPGTLGLWFEYFSNANPHYAASNTVVALGLADVLGPGARILELGGGGGSAAIAVLGALHAAGRTPSSYVFTELQPAFLRRGTRNLQAALPAGCSLESLRVDIELPLADQGLAGREFDAIVAVNTLHLARDLVATLTRLRGALAEGGWLVLGELVRPPRGAVHIELPFALLSSYGAAGHERSRPGFMTLAGWRRSLGQAGFTEVRVVPRALDDCLALYPGFYCAALLARA